MARTKSGLIYSLAKLPQVLEKNSELEKRIARLEKIILGTTPAKRGPKPGRKRGRKPGRRGRKPGPKPKAKRLCTVPGCGRPHYAKGLCASHYQTALRKKKLAKKV
jgi:hypothetical protein